MSTNKLYQSWWSNPPWLLVIISFAFWPLGLLLLIRKVTVDRRLSLIMGPLLKASGYGIAGFFTLLAIPMPFAADSIGAGIFACIVMLAFAALGIALISFGRKVDQAAIRRKILLDIIVNQNCLSIDDLAQNLGEGNVMSLMSEVQSLVDSRFLPNMTLDTNARKLLRSSNPASKANAGSGPVSTFKCRCCGANNSGVTVCEYCGSAP